MKFKTKKNQKIHEIPKKTENEGKHLNLKDYYQKTKNILKIKENTMFLLIFLFLKEIYMFFFKSNDILQF